MCSMHTYVNCYCMCALIENTDVGCMLKYIVHYFWCIHEGSVISHLTLTGRRAFVINFTCDVMHTPTSFPRTAIIGMNVCVA